MEFKRKFGKQRKSKPKKGLFLILLLIIAIYVFVNIEQLLERIL